MTYSIEPSYLFITELSRLLIKAGTDPKNQWFFVDGALSTDNALESSGNTWLHENFVVIYNNNIIAYFEGTWNRPLDIIISFRLITLDKEKSMIATKAFFKYIDYIFVARGCNAFNWIVAEKNLHALQLYEKFITKYFGHKVGKRSHGQKGYSGDTSDVILYEVTREEYFYWKNNQK